MKTYATVLLMVILLSVDACDKNLQLEMGI